MTEPGVKIDWNQLWQEHRLNRSWRSKTSSAWDEKANEFAERNLGSGYTEAFIRHLNPDPTATILDIGCGPGTLALPLACLVKQVTAIDFSPGMLAVLTQKAAAAGLTNITTIKAAWEDDWQALNIPAHDIAIASRSLAVVDLKAALLKLNAWATQKVMIGDRVGAGQLNPEIFAAVGRPFETGPDYIYTVNILHQMGIYAQVDFVTMPRDKTYKNRQEAFFSLAWMLDDLTKVEEKKLNEFLDQRLIPTPDHKLQFTSRLPQQWALLSWDKPRPSQKTRNTL